MKRNARRMMVWIMALAMLMAGMGSLALAEEVPVEVDGEAGINGQPQNPADEAVIDLGMGDGAPDATPEGELVLDPDMGDGTPDATPEGELVLDPDMDDGVLVATPEGELALDLDLGRLEDATEASSPVTGSTMSANGSGTQDDPIAIRSWDALRESLSEAGIRDGESADNPTCYKIIGIIQYKDSSGNPLVVGANRNIVLDMYGFEIQRDADKPVEDGWAIKVEGHLTVINTYTYLGSIVGGNNTSDGGSVYVANGGVFTLKSGGVGLGNATNGGGVFVAGGGTFNMEGGMVLMNKAKTNGGGVYVAEGGTFNMSGGTIGGDGKGYDKPAKNSGTGGGVYVAEGGAFNMSDGEISYNSGVKGGGVYAAGEFRLTGGRILVNKGVTKAGGVYVTGRLVMTGGRIADQQGISTAAGVYVTDGGVFIMSGGEISNNNTKSSGGGVYVDGGAFTLSGGEISNNSAKTSGGGVYVKTGAFNLSGAPEIRDNQAQGRAGNVGLKDPGVCIIVAGGLGNQTPIGVAFDGEVPSGTVFTSGLSGHGTAQSFASEQNGNFEVRLADTGEAALFAKSGFGLPKVPEPDAAVLARMTVSGSDKTALELAWTKARDAYAYDVYFAKCGGNFKLKATVKTSESRVVRFKGLDRRGSYKAYVKAWKLVNDRKVYLGDSPEVHTITGGYDAKYCNAKSVKLNKTSVSLKVGKSVTLKATVKGVKSGRKLLTHVRKVRYYSSNVNVATVNKNGKINATGKGKCTVYAIANNGVRTSVKVTVK